MQVGVQSDKEEAVYGDGDGEMMVASQRNGSAGGARGGPQGAGRAMR